MKILITGAGGFIGSCFVRRTLKTTEHTIRAFVRNTNQNRIKGRLLSQTIVQNSIANGRLELIYGDLTDDISELCDGMDAVVHMGAKTHVDTSIKAPQAFVNSNIIGTFNLLESARKAQVGKFILVSTDEVYSSITNGEYSENSALNPTNPYSATKASADCLTIAYANTYKLNTLITRTENNYGFYQCQKVIPVFVRAAMNGEPLPVYDNGKQIRAWLWVEDHVDGILMLLNADTKPGSIWNIGGGQEMENIELAKKILRYLNKPEDQIKFITVRPGHDFRYALNNEKIRSLGWAPKMNVEEGLKKAVEWYSKNLWWN